MSWESIPVTEEDQQFGGVTTSERYLNKLAYKSFLSLWSYPNLFASPGKELCDLLVVFGNHVLIFSDKDCDFSSDVDELTAWRRWYKKAIKKSAKQVWGAERHLKNHRAMIYLDPKCNTPFPLAIPTSKNARYHRIIIAHGASAKCQARFGGSGSLMLHTGISADEHLEVHDEGIPLYAVGQVDPSKGFVHVFDDVSLDIVLQTLDTISDFIAYLEKKEALIQRGITVIAGGEEELLADYLKNINQSGEHDFLVPHGKTIVIFQRGLWLDFTRSLEWRAKQNDDRLSYTWDDIIERFADAIKTDTQYLPTSSTLSEMETVLRFMAREPRMNRRTLMRLLYDTVNKNPEMQLATRIFTNTGSSQSPYYIFLVSPHYSHVSDSEYRVVRRYQLEVHARVVRMLFPEALDIVALGTETRNAGSRSHDLLYFDGRDWTAEDDANARKLQEEYSILKSATLWRIHEDEYRQMPLNVKEEFRTGKIGRNQTCPCGSGKKYKKCCGRADVRNKYGTSY